MKNEFIREGGNKYGEESAVNGDRAGYNACHRD